LNKDNKIIITMEDLEVETGANVKIKINKVFGPLCATSVRVYLEYNHKKSDWVVEHLDWKSSDWVEMARWDCQEGMEDE